MTGIPGGYDYSTPPPASAKRLEAGWGERIGWTVPVWGSLGLFALVPFLYVALRRGLPSDWTACISFFVYEAAVWTWLIVLEDGAGDGVFGLTLIFAMVMGTALTLFALFDPKPNRPPLPYGAGPRPNPYQQNYPYGR
ncbi:hypothetical protein ABZX85_41065 [Streptomyces sp. NPDC004539]|uniref:hypothetical protein n=1 Tax=Streptomyces sp. NPDC004539 TaxID=3154280 RepID=UPI0033A55123